MQTAHYQRKCANRESEGAQTLSGPESRSNPSPAAVARGLGLLVPPVARCPATAPEARPTVEGMHPHRVQAVRHAQTSLFPTDPEPHTLAEAISRYRLEHLHVDDLAQNTIAWREAALLELADWADRPIAGRWRDVGAELYARARRRGRSEAVASLHCNTLARVLNLAESWGWRQGGHDLKGICRVRSRRRVVHIQVEQLEAIGRALVELGDRERLAVAADAVRLVFLTGMRASEAAGLRWAEVDFDQKLIHLEQSKTGPRPVILADVAVGLLRSLHARRVSAWVFTRRRGDGPLHRRQLLHALTEACARARVPKLVVHGLRHYFATVGGVQLELPGPSMAIALGHSDAWQTSQYQHPRLEDVRRVVDKVASKIAGDLLGKPSRKAARR